MLSLQIVILLFSRRIRLHKSRAQSCSSSDASDDDRSTSEPPDPAGAANPRLKKRQDVTGPSCHFMTKSSQVRRGENDDSSDNQDSGMAGGSGSGGGGSMGSRLGRTHESGTSRSTNTRTESGGGKTLLSYNYIVYGSNKHQNN